MQNRLVFFLIVIAVILAIAGFLLVSFLTRGPAERADVPEEQPMLDGETLPESIVPDGIAVQVDNTTVFLNPAAERTVTLQTEEQIQQPTPQPLEPTPEPTVEIITPTEPPAATVAPAPAAAAGQSVTFIDYVVQQGDTLYRITEKHTTSIELMSVHGISSEDIVPGNTLRLPVANPGYCPAGSRTYVVRPGDNVFRIARQYNTTTQAIASANNLGPDFRINIAQVLCIP
ncbi:MAG TPA: LysM peptidoglycan-binding domain-containing protein [Candidatus Sulfomarinibacteraceae bacterium]|nr:LysM peptidoglycan-binding domain-containing protein [Candidatus Sulfomarinibacteraceae bacterium]